jgi:hypothetical protein
MVNDKSALACSFFIVSEKGVKNKALFWHFLI